MNSFLKEATVLKAFNDSVITDDEFRRFCNNFGLSSMRLKLAHDHDNRVRKVLEEWTGEPRTFTDLIAVLEKWPKYLNLKR